MLTTATVRSHGRTDDTTAGLIADLWNTAYPTLRAIATNSGSLTISSIRS